MLKYRQRGNKDDRAQYFQEEERQTLIVHTAGRRSLSLRWQIRAVFKHLGGNLYEAKANIRGFRKNEGSNTSITSN